MSDSRDLRELRERYADLTHAIDRVRSASPFRPLVMLGQIYNAGRAPTAAPGVFAFHPVTDVTNESEGATPTTTVLTDIPEVGLVLDRIPPVGSILRWHLIDGYWIAEREGQSGSTCPVTLCVLVQNSDDTEPPPFDATVVDNGSGVTIATFHWNGFTGLPQFCVDVTPGHAYTVTVTVVDSRTGYARCTYTQSVSVPIDQPCGIFRITMTICCGPEQVCFVVVGCGADTEITTGCVRVPCDQLRSCANHCGSLPIEGATVDVPGLGTGTTNANGVACFDVPANTPAGTTYTATASYPDFTATGTGQVKTTCSGYLTVFGVGSPPVLVSNTICMSPNDPLMCSCCGGGFTWPKVLTGSCARGAVTLTMGQGGNPLNDCAWYGQISWTEPEAGQNVNYAPIPGVCPVTFCCEQNSAVVTVGFAVVARCGTDAMGNPVVYWWAQIDWAACGGYGTVSGGVYTCADPPAQPTTCFNPPFNAPPCPPDPLVRCIGRLTPGTTIASAQPYFPPNTIGPVACDTPINFTFPFDLSPATPPEMNITSLTVVG